VYDIGKVGRRHFFAMHFVQGPTLDILIEQDEVSPKRAAGIAQKLAHALEHAHSFGVLHRDVKPENVIIDQDGEPQLTDFGLAKDVELESNITISGTRVGTPRYMAPEQAEARHDAVDQRTDVYGIGATLYAMLTAMPPYDAPSLAQIFDRITRTDPVPPRKVNPRIPKDLETICLKALEKERKRRYKSCDELAEDLGSFLEGEPIMARPVSLVYRSTKRVRRNPTLYATLAGAVLLVSLIALFFLAVKPAMDSRAEREGDRKALVVALAKKREPEQDSLSLLAAAEESFENRKYEKCAEICDRIEMTFGDLQGAKFDGLPHVRHQEVTREATFAPLGIPYHFPLAEAAGLKARARLALSDRAGARGAWARTYWRARQDLMNHEEGGQKVITLLHGAIEAIGSDLLEKGDFVKALGAFTEAETVLPGRPATRMGLARCYQARGRFEEAREQYQWLLVQTPENSEVEKYAADALSLIETLTPVRRFPLPLPAPSETGGIAAIVEFDFEKDGRSELMVFCRDMRVFALGLESGGLSVKWSGKLPTALDWRSGPTIMKALFADPDGDGTEELIVGLGFWNSSRAELSVFEWNGRAFIRGASHLEPEGRYVTSISVGKISGTGREEILAAFHSPDRGLGLFRYSEGSIEWIQSLRTGSSPKGVLLTRGSGFARMIFSLGEFSHYRFLSAHIDPTEGGILVDPERPAVRTNAHALTFLDGEDRFAFSIPATEAGDIPWWSVINNVQDEPEECLCPGIYTASLKGWPRIDPRPVFLENGEGHLGGAYITWPLAGRDRFAFPRAMTGRQEWVIHLGPVGKSDWMRILARAHPEHLGLADLDGDVSPEIFCTFRDATCMVLGWGKVEPKLRRTSREKDSPVGVADPTLAMARSLSDMGLSGEAARVFALAAGSSSSGEVRGNALLGMGDALAKDGKWAEALQAFGEALALPSARARALLSLAWLLEDRGMWRELNSILERELAVGRLPRDIETKMSELRRKSEPLSNLAPVVALIGKGGRLHPLTQCTDPLTVSLGSEGIRLHGDASRSTKLLLPVKFSSESFRIEVDFELERLDWATGISLALAIPDKKSETGCLGALTGGVKRIGVHFDPWYSTSFPLCQMRILTPWGGGAPELLQEFPPRYPQAYSLSVDYSRELRFWRVELRNEKGDILVRRKGETDSLLPRGNAFLELSVARGGVKTNQPGWREFKAGILVHRAELFASWSGTFTEAMSAIHGEDHLSRAAGSVVADSLDARGAFEKVLARGGEGGPEGCIGELPGWPHRKARAHLFRGVWLFRRGASNEGVKDVLEALHLDPAETLFLILRDFPFLPDSDRRFLGDTILGAALDRNGTWIEALTRRLVERGEISEKEGRASLEGLSRGNAGKRERLTEVVKLFLGAYGNVAFAHRVFGRTLLEPQLRALRRRNISEEAAGKRGGIHDFYVRRRYEEFLGEFAHDPDVLHDFVLFLTTVPRKKSRDPGKALVLSGNAVSRAREKGEAVPLARYLSVHAKALSAVGEVEKAAGALEEALSLIPENFPARDTWESELRAIRRGGNGK
jgi:tetratricopeptide (TPR) repeat protein